MKYCEGRCLEMVLDILQRNNIQRNGFCSAVRELLEKGREKDRNILLNGPENCDKPFLLNPLTVFYSPG